MSTSTSIPAVQVLLSMSQKPTARKSTGGKRKVIPTATPATQQKSQLTGDSDSIASVSVGVLFEVKDGATTSTADTPTGGRTLRVREPKEATAVTRFRRGPGFLAMRQIRRYQRSTEMLIPRLPFQRLVRQVTEELEVES
ncbi:histone H3.3-like type 2 [Orchesella cincta]|uniref:Histone H3.3-like type 2 n=1 Tax=Orchesella cincta TaxID=48709 RepID=A0A1D2NFC1_ORCCI|nr:histone H3.3-like type 2 [Orchesella cincta]